MTNTKTWSCSRQLFVHTLPCGSSRGARSGAPVQTCRVPAGKRRRKTVMETEELRALQAPLKDRYKTEPGAALITLKGHGRLGEGLTCKGETGKALVAAGLHPATGGNGLEACSGDMLLEALVACAGV